ncbi:hypothetical protein Mal64_01760 [Pseudobythopirellula maris]|uniref:RND transporter n=1 Tax=Pseudobythopirellula maris TaxID=2527991 RepID=A0A5C5ZS68_9BACT|nr:RND transporter [Pseudobythopirellula maris]TWT89797.1 hypothetical protein Mal64_01760 [Pseudobythopirellula maris]
MNYKTNHFLAATLTTALLAMAGCGPSDTAEHDEHEHAETETVAHDHSGWWCVEHAIPEEVCTRCDLSLIAGYKADGDWCEEHNRPESLCFLCTPALAEPFAARYEAKFGKAPPEPTDP